jgi:hypothetical protein
MIDILVEIITDRGGPCIVRLFSIIPGLTLLFPIPSNCDNKKCFQILPNVHRGAKSFPVENHCSVSRQNDKEG